MFIYFVIFLSSSCGYEPLNKSLNSKKINITDKIFVGDKVNKNF